MTVNPLPASQRALIQGEDEQLHVVDDDALPTLTPGHVIVKTSHVGLAHSDHKLLRYFPLPGAHAGLDFAGTVVKAADDVDTNALPLGTVVCGHVFTFSTKARLASGSYSQYVRARADLLLRVPPADHSSSLIRSPREAATLSSTLCTCILSIWAQDALALEGTPDKPLCSEKPPAVLVYGGSTATGTVMLQLLKLSGYEPIATCSPHSNDLVRSRGASAIFDYRRESTAEEIKEYTGGRLKYAIDCISDASSVATCYGAIQRPGGRYVSLEVVADELLAKRQAVKPTFVLAAEVSEEEVNIGSEGYDRPANAEKRALAAQFMLVFQRLVDEGKLEAHPTELIEGGLQGILKGIERLAAGDVRGKKLVAAMD